MGGQSKFNSWLSVWGTGGREFKSPRSDQFAACSRRAASTFESAVGHLTRDIARTFFELLRNLLVIGALKVIADATGNVVVSGICGCAARHCATPLIATPLAFFWRGGARACESRVFPGTIHTMRKLLPLLVSVLTVGSMGLARADAQSVMLSLLFGEEGLPSGQTASVDGCVLELRSKDDGPDAPPSLRLDFNKIDLKEVGWWWVTIST